MKLAAFLAGCCALLGACAGPADHRHPRDIVAPHAGRLRGDEAALQGSWVAARGGLPAASTLVLGRVAYDFHGRRYYSGQAQGGGYFRVDESRRPKRIDFDDGHSPVVRGIYELRGAELVLCTAPPGASRPTRLGPSTARQFSVLYRQGRAR